MTRSPSAPELRTRSFRIGDYLVVQSTNAIGDVRVDPKAMDVLVALAEAAPHVLSADALFERVWPNVVVGDNSLYQAIAQLRKALGDQARAPRFIEHVSRRGYRLLVSVEWQEQPANGNSIAPSGERAPQLTATSHTNEPPARMRVLVARHRRLAWSSLSVVVVVAIMLTWLVRGTEPVKTVAVFPFENMTSDLALDDVAVGLSDELRRRLGPIPGLRILAASSVESPRLLGVGRIEGATLLRITHAVRGQLQRTGSAISVVMQIEDERGEKLWSGRFQRDRSQMLELQTDVNASVVQALVDDLDAEQKASLRRNPTNDARAWELYLRTRRYKDRYTLDTLDAAIAQLEEAIQRDPSFALAYAMLADVQQSRQQVAHLRSEEQFNRAQRYVDEALRLDPNLAEAHTVAAIIRDQWLWDVKGAERMHLRAIELDPNLPEAWVYLIGHYTQFGDWRSARESLDEIHRVDPIGPYSAILFSSVPMMGYWYTRDRRLIDESLVAIEDVKQRDSRFWVAYWGECMVRSARGEFEAAVRAGRRALQFVEDSRVVEPDLAVALVRAGHRDEAQAIVASLDKQASEHYFSPSRLAMAHAALGNTERSLELLESAVKDRDWEIFWVAPGDHFDAMRSSVRFQKVYRSLGIPEPEIRR